ncbi:MAG TPA: Trk system potassium transporter TrkA [Ignavibacteriaceae bacterium]|jgi:trk system potassium uptake protein TrkA|nr:MAG: Trk system potassium uptake protein TrkA [Ignavibacteria bacterium ADurb.Bin266]OQY72453.1 MAG: Trk system potassium transport protein TrkA [Ignavibacteriales bacterium UTCHB2]HQF42269.1 Trk system potassium transporter TrkA [Ignavibacteriaceae bacterium]HQI42117.1 Trk system potassium transporter TrkA [Ignavibacteriaceae bacterium]
MRIIIAGMGDVGYQLAKQLSIESHDIIAIDLDQDRLSYTDQMADILTINGSSTSISTLKKADIDKADLLVAVTSSEEVNLTSAILAKKLGAKRTIARISNDEYLESSGELNFKELGVDFMIYPEGLAATETVNLINRTAATDVLEFEDGKLSVMGLRLDKSAAIIQKKIFEVTQEFKNIDFRVVAIHRNFRTIVPTGNDKFLPNDQVFVISKPEGHDTILRLAGKENIQFDNIMILGGGKIGRRVASMLSDKMTVKLIDSDPDKAYELADQLPNTLVIKGDGRDIDLLAQEGIIDVDAFVAVTEDAETNIISCLMAKHLGVKKAIALVDKVDYIPLTQTIGLDSLINKKLISANNIVRFIKKGGLVSYSTLEGIDAVILEYIAQPGSHITQSKLAKLDLPKGTIIGGFIRNDEGHIGVGESKINAGDKVVVFSLPDAIEKLEKFFVG